MENKKSVLMLLIVLVATIFIIIFFYTFKNLEDDFIAVYENNVLLIQKELLNVNDILEIIGSVANEVINNEDIGLLFENNENKDIINYFEYDEKENLFHLDNIVNSTYNSKYMNNITGIGDLTFLEDKESLKSKEIYLSLILNDYFLKINEKIDESHWTYYTSLNSFMSIRRNNAIFPLSSEFRFTSEVLDLPFVTNGTLEKLPDRNSVFWTHPYIDLAGSGLIVTASYPVDYKDEYIGSISVDFMSESLNGLLNKKHTSFVVDEDGTILATNLKNVLGDELVNIDDINLGVTLKEIKGLENDKIHKINGVRIISFNMDGTQYQTYQMYLPRDYWNDVFIEFLPIFIYLLLFVVLVEINLRVHRSEKKLIEALNKLEVKQKELDFISKFDQLTKVYNRRGLYDRLDILEEEGSIVNASGILLDIDHFKEINDNYGHDVGDTVLEKLCGIIKKYTREEDIIARYGGEEFIVIVNESDLKSTIEIAEKIRQAVEENNFLPNRKLTISAGVATYKDAGNIKEWFKYADNCLYQSKKSGRNKVSYYKMKM